MKPTQILLAATVIGLTACSGEPSMTDFIGTYEKSQKGNDQSTLEIFKHEGTLMIKGALAETNSYAMKRIFIEVPPLNSARGNLVKSVFEKENGLEEAIHRRTNHWFFEAGGSRHAGQGVVPAAWLQ